VKAVELFSGLRHLSHGAGLSKGQNGGLVGVNCVYGDGVLETRTIVNSLSSFWMFILRELFGVSFMESLSCIDYICQV